MFFFDHRLNGLDQIAQTIPATALLATLDSIIIVATNQYDPICVVVDNDSKQIQDVATENVHIQVVLAHARCIVPAE